MSSNIPSIDKGWMRFYSAFRPALFSNQYEVTLKQEIKDGKQQGKRPISGMKSVILMSPGHALVCRKQKSTVSFHPPMPPAPFHSASHILR